MHASLLLLLLANLVYCHLILEQALCFEKLHFMLLTQVSLTCIFLQLSLILDKISDDEVFVINLYLSVAKSEVNIES